MDRARRLLRQGRRILVLTGAGISTEAGIPDFRSPGGLWQRIDPSRFTLQAFRADPAAFWRLRAELHRELDLTGRQPTAAHRALAEFSRGGRLLGLVTQNIDGLHERAGTPEDLLARLHGSAFEVACTACGRRAPSTAAQGDLDADVLPPRCPHCRGPLKPGTVLFGEEMPKEPWERALDWARRCDLCLVVGSSLAVWPAASLPEVALQRGAPLVVVNRDPTPLDAEADAVVREPASEAVPRLLA